MSDTFPNDPEDPDAVLFNERSSAFIDNTAFLNFLRLKSLVASEEGSLAKIAATSADAEQAPSTTPADQEKVVSLPRTDAAKRVEIEDEDWDSLFGAVEERLRGTVEALDPIAPELASPDKLSRIKSVVLDCVSSLDALHKALRHDRGLHLAGGPDRNTAGVKSASYPTSANDPSRKY